MWREGSGGSVRGVYGTVFVERKGAAGSPHLADRRRRRRCIRDGLAIPQGSTRAYGQLARRIAALTGRRGSARAVGGAVGRNPISIMVPCHRVVGADGAVVGYAGGTDRKIRLLRLEGADLPGPDLAQDGIPGL